MKKIQNSFIKHTAKEFKKLLEIDNKLQEYEVKVIESIIFGKEIL